MNADIQYIILFIIILCTLIWIIFRLRELFKNPPNNGCAGCSLSENCNKKKLHSLSPKDKDCNSI